jgi:drug/metabolite transporter (DMT)-like permease
MDGVTPEAGALVSIVMNVITFWTLAAVVMLRNGAPPLPARALILFIVGGLAGTLVGRNLSYLSIERIGPSLLVTIRLSQTIVTLLLGLAFLGEFPRPWQLGGLASVLVGLWISLRSREGDGPVRGAPAARRLDLAALLLAFASAAAFAFGDTARRAALVIVPAPVLGAAVGSSAALLAHLIWSITRHSARWPARPALRSVDLWTSALFNTLAILFLYTALRSSPVAIVSTLYNLQVLVVLVGSRVLLRGRETVGGGLVVGSGLALAGTAMILLG